MGLAITASIFITVLGFALRATLDDALYLFKHPVLLLRAVVAMKVVMPVFVGLVVAIFPLNHVIEIALVAISVSPVPPVLPKKAFKAGGRRSYTIGLLTAISLLSIIIVPLGITIFAKVFNRPSGYDLVSVTSTILTGVLIPLALGIIIRHFAPAFAERVADTLTKIGTIVLILAFLPFLVVSLPTIWTLIGDGTLLPITAFVIVGITVGHLLGGPDPDDRTVLAISTATRHPGIAIAIATTYSPEPTLAATAVILYLIVSGIVAGPYQYWLSGRHNEKVTGDSDKSELVASNK